MGGRLLRILFRQDVEQTMWARMYYSVHDAKDMKGVFFVSRETDGSCFENREGPAPSFDFGQMMAAKSTAGTLNQCER